MTPLHKHYSKVAALGCVVCKQLGFGFVPAELHHPFGRKNGHEFHVIPLCHSHHREGVNKPDIGYISRHPWRRAFIEAYGSEQSLLDRVDYLLRRLHEPN